MFCLLAGLGCSWTGRIVGKGRSGIVPGFGGMTGARSRLGSITDWTAFITPTRSDVLHDCLCFHALLLFRDSEISRSSGL